MFKDVYKAALGEKAAQYQTVGFLVSSACAEVIADVMLCPMEAVSTPFFVTAIFGVAAVAMAAAFVAKLKRKEKKQNISQGVRIQDFQH